MGDQTKKDGSIDVPPQGEGFPMPEGGWKYGKKIGNPYYYMKEEKYLKEMQDIEKRVTLQLAFAYIKDINPLISQFENRLGDDSIVIIGDDDLSFASLLFESNLLKCKKVKTSELESLDLDATKQIVIISGGPVVLEEEIKGIEKLSTFVENGGLLISFNEGGSIVESAFQGKIQTKKGLTSVDKRIILDVKAGKTELFHM